MDEKNVHVCILDVVMLMFELLIHVLVFWIHGLAMCNLDISKHIYLKIAFY